MECPRCGSFAADGSRFCADCGASLAGERDGAPVRASLTSPSSQTVAGNPPERRHLTVMFCDLVGSAALAARLDPDELGAALATYRARVSEVIGRFDGFIAERLGDSVLIYFGYPHAQEDDAERAVRAALDIIEAVQTIRPRVDASLQCRIGVATGLVTIAGAAEREPNQPPKITGEPTVLAARMQALAAPSMVVLPQSTRRLLGDLFAWGDLGIVMVPGIADPIQAWRVLGPSRVASRFEALRGGGVSPLVGRQAEMRLLLGRCARAKVGQGQAVLVRAEAGIGKSRLIAAFEGQRSLRR
jgi:class 3 adenylate cyclase